MKKLEVGCGRKPLKGFETIDIEPYSKPNYIGDFREMNFGDVDEIQAHHLLEHFGRGEAPKILKLWYSWLKPGGVLVVEVPDFEGVCVRFSSDLNDKHRHWLCRHIYGSQEAGWTYHKEGYWEKKLVSLVSRAGFKVLSTTKSNSRVYLPNITVKAEKV